MYALAGPVTARGFALPNLGLVDADAKIVFGMGNGVPWSLRANAAGRMARIDNGTLANLTAIATTLPLEAGDRLGLTLDLAWAYGLIGQVFLGLSRGACLVECRHRPGKPGSFSCLRVRQH